MTAVQQERIPCARRPNETNRAICLERATPWPPARRQRCRIARGDPDQFVGVVVSACDLAREGTTFSLVPSRRIDRRVDLSIATRVTDGLAPVKPPCEST